MRSTFQAKNIKPNRTVILCFSLLVILSCTLAGDPQVQTPDSSAIETDVALRVMSTSLANQEMTLQAMQTGMALQLVTPIEVTPPASETAQPSQEPTQTEELPPPDLVLGIRTSTNAFYCYQPPYELTITVTVSDIERGMAVYYHIEDKFTGVESVGQVSDLHRRSSDTRSATIIGGGSVDQNLQFPPLMHESYFIYQIISDDGDFRSPVFSDITFFPCAQ